MTADGMTPKSARLAIFAGGLWLPVAMSAVYFIRFGSFKAEGVSAMDLFLDHLLFYLLGCATVWLFTRSVRRHPQRVLYVSLVYLPFVLLSFFGALLGGLLGPIGVLLNGLVLFVIPWFIWRVVPKKQAEDPQPTVEEKTNQDP